ncbi:SDR family oxidoreductase [Halomonas eurihalina]|uniref:SDR family oxidoreductase n=1 Tax=Halomonas eurihalina TaxID=42566 RepID=A0A5D9D9Y6_HALER|nr:SDR family NAD(P)-dependent oxidoreductase [Halomonas eurihalina]MDR5858569.1 SDR family NAD(P)-dependent oxidoreductase [Halomonas eurihalina]TZG40758.1 SDR family oxidoreductase [Halomonas eurihalina]
MSIEAFNLDGKTAIVTGAGRGLGKAIAIGLASAGANVLLASRNPEHLSGTAAEIEHSGGQAIRTSVDISDPASCDALVSRAEEEFGQLDILVCNAATNIQGPAADMPPSAWSRVINTEMSGCFYLSQAAYKVMAKQSSGSIIMISANSSTVGYADLVGVATAKGGVDMMARNLAIEWGQDGIRVNTINPGFTEHVPEDGADVAAGDGDLEEDIRAATPLERRGRVEEFANPAIFLASDAASYVTGHNLVVDGGYSVK